MKNIKKMVATMMMAAVLLVGTTFGKDGMLMSDFAGQQNNDCNQSAAKDGILVVGFTGILVVGFTGIIIVGATDNNDRDASQCRDGIMMSD